MYIKKISTKIFFGIFLLSIFFLVVETLTITLMYREELKANEIQNNLLVQNKTRSQFDLILNLIQSTYSYLNNNSDIRNYLYYSENIDVESKLKENLNNILEMQPFIEDFHILNRNGDLLSTNTDGDMDEIKEIYSEYLDREWNYASDGEWTNLHYLKSTSDKTGVRKVVSFINPFLGLGNNFLGILVIDLNFNYLQEMFMVSSIQSNEKTIIVNSRGEILFNFPYYTSFEPVLKEYPELKDSSVNRKIEGKVFNMNSTIVSDSLRISDWIIIRIIQTENLIKNTNKITYYSVAIIIASSITCLLYAFWLTNKITNPIKILNKACNKIKDGDFNLRVDLKSNDEVGNLGITFNMMLDKLNNYFNNELNEQKRKSALEFKVLQSQINPHFLYNTLDSIRWLAAMQNVTNVADMTSKLTTLLKYNLKQDTTSTLIKDELDSVRCYIEIQKYRYGNYFEVEYNVEQETLDCIVLPFCIQPIIENSILHGFDDVEKNYWINIEVFIEENKLFIKIRDNGSGMDEEILTKVNLTKHKSNKFNQIGINNIRERIQIQFGSEYGLFYESELGQGATAILKFPLNK